MRKLDAGGTILTGQWRNFDLFWLRARRKHGQITFCSSIPIDKPKTFTTNSFRENLHENRTPEFKPSCGKKHWKKKNQIKCKNNKKNCTQTIRSSWLSLKHTWDQCLPLAKQCFYLHAFSLLCPGLWLQAKFCEYTTLHQEEKAGKQRRALKCIPSPTFL